MNGHDSEWRAGSGEGQGTGARTGAALDAALARLSLEQAPPRDLWPAIERELARAPVRATTNRPFALAASVAALALLGALAWNMRGPYGDATDAARSGTGQLAQSPGLAAPAGGAVLPASASYGPPDNAAYEAARVKLARTFEERLDLLAPATQARVRADLATIRAANADLRAALAKDPASPLLLQLLASTWRQEIDLYASVARTTSPLIQRRTRT
jgi:hypothetical protein